MRRQQLQPHKPAPPCTIPYIQRGPRSLLRGLGDRKVTVNKASGRKHSSQLFRSPFRGKETPPSPPQGETQALFEGGGGRGTGLAH